MSHHDRDVRSFLRRMLMLAAGALASAACARRDGSPPMPPASAEDARAPDAPVTAPPEGAAPPPSPAGAQPPESKKARQARLERGVMRARPVPAPARRADAPGPGRHRLGLGGARDGLLYVPRGYHPTRPAPLVVLLHGAGGEAAHGLSLLEGFADARGAVLLAPDSRGSTWDIIADDGYGPDVAFLDSALERVFDELVVDPARVAIGGFSDGASYALSLGLANGDLFRDVLAFSPGFVAPAARTGTPRIFVSHGTRDGVLPIEACSRRIVPRLRNAGYVVRYREFDGPHVVPPGIAREALEAWLSAAG